jgi:hypothetical protein
MTNRASSAKDTTPVAPAVLKVRAGRANPCAPLFVADAEDGIGEPATFVHAAVSCRKAQPVVYFRVMEKLGIGRE